jgi:hypothetical protein
MLIAACGGDKTPSGATPAGTATISSATATPAARVTPSTEPAATTTPVVQITGVVGVALVGPACPVIRQDTPCPDRPWEGTVVAQTRSGKEVARINTDAEGGFMLALQPGDYVILTLTMGILPAPVSVDVTVVKGQLTEVELLLDSGIR